MYELNVQSQKKKEVEENVSWILNNEGDSTIGSILDASEEGKYQSILNCLGKHVRDVREEMWEVTMVQS